MMNAINLNLGNVHDAVVSAPFLRRLLPGRVETEDPIRVDVHVRSYDEAKPLAPRACALGARTGRLPVGTLLDCYL